ncbi:hypothetical protein GCM10011318_00340 [Phaeocystidibacter marisrubri]|nr:hypothetical protein GCM10011318_00340 [Phaeocystidibacter marisrubri]
MEHVRLEFKRDLAHPSETGISSFESCSFEIEFNGRCPEHSKARFLQMETANRESLEEQGRLNFNGEVVKGSDE